MEGRREGRKKRNFGREREKEGQQLEQTERERGEKTEMMLMKLLPPQDGGHAGAICQAGSQIRRKF